MAHDIFMRLVLCHPFLYNTSKSPLNTIPAGCPNKTFYIVQIKALFLFGKYCKIVVLSLKSYTGLRKDSVKDLYRDLHLVIVQEKFL